MRTTLLAVPCGPALLLALLPPVPGGETSAAPVPQVAPVVEPASHRSYQEKIPGSRVTLDLVAIPGGVFLMGSPEGEAGREADEGPPHPVKVAPFWMARCEITWDSYDLYRAARDAEAEAARAVPGQPGADAITGPSPPYIDPYRDFGREGYPVIGITHHAAVEYCRWLSEKTGKAYRLPTEAEWEWACRAGRQTAYSFGGEADRLGDYAWYEANAAERTHPVGGKKPSPWGLYDMHGNAAEWCLDHYDAGFYATFPPDRPSPAPVRLPTARRFPHVVRGGSWADAAGQCRSASRRGSDPRWNRSDAQLPRGIWWLGDCDFVGFRVVRAVSEQGALKGLRSKVTPESR